MSDQPPPVKMNDNRPYLIRALHEWISDNGCTPYMVVQADVPGVQVPEGFVQDGRITLNVANRSVQSLNLGNEEVIFSATFGGQLEHIRVPCQAIAALFAKENGQGMVFEVKPDSPPPAGGDDDSGPSASGGDKSEGRPGDGKRPRLKVVK
ncbi:MAG: ClpXP protease specificity-enhancing factor [Natronospirillum sp.]|uniref:ClpXP protease specificity-enhancing factor n=1 Tax=Natronospirillum sp. TaxID=2812955 RepID=UPI0025F5DAD4|nr:ClpXP protease specificity-enhancing factor [Natronospirillum sp.]MCH8550590.1 ClpXP protease specificity-enhancing factor [Natronospirillum sp.]